MSVGYRTLQHVLHLETGAASLRIPMGHIEFRADSAQFSVF
jgi:hypothetical protein